MLTLITLLIAAGIEQPPAAAPTPQAAKSYRIPYKLSDTQHILVRAKINGKGPYTFIMDTGAPEIFFAKDTAQKIGITKDKNDEAVIEKLEIEGGAILNRIEAHIADPSQLVGMNAMGLTDTRIEGVLGYNVLARYRIELDPTQNKMLWTRLDFTPPSLNAMRARPGEKAIEPSADYLAMENMTKSLGGLFGKKGETQIVLRGFFGIEFAAEGTTSTIAAVLPGSPAAAAGLKAGDRLAEAAVSGGTPQPVGTKAEAMKLLGKAGPGDAFEITVKRGSQTVKVKVAAGKGGV
jgi:hypothetical protein